jgi:nitrite reductase/ring-hydroxylating ferredoxin subunit
MAIPPRRNFLKLVAGGTLLGAAAPLMYAVLRYLAPLPGRAISMAAGNISAIASGPKQIRVGTTDVLLMKQSSSIVAFDLKCTHAGCTVTWMADQNAFHCPCHGGTYDINGAMKSGPPPMPLRRLRVQVDAAGEMTVTDILG